MLTLLERLRQDNSETDGDIVKAIDDERFEFLIRDDKPIGFFTYEFLHKNLRLWCFITNLYIEPYYRRKGNLLFLRRYMKSKVPKDCVVYWHSGRRNKFSYGENR